MNVVRFCDLDELTPLAAEWDRLSGGVPFCTWAWMSTWWRHYGEAVSGRRSRNSLYVLGVFDPSDRLIGIAPWYMERSLRRGRVLRFLGSGEVCSEYLRVLADPSAEDRVCEAIAQWLADAARGGMRRGHKADRWDLLELTGVDANDSSVYRLADALRARGSLVHQGPAPSCWRIDLPETWEEYLAMLSRGRRKQLRSAERKYVESGRAVAHVVQREADLARGIDMLIDLHQRRRRALGEPGCFASPRLTAFHRDVMPLLLQSGRLHLFWIELDGKPAVAEYFLLGPDATYSYQAGLNPECMSDSPGRLGNLIGLRHAMALGHRAFDFLRGDEPYKVHFRATPRPMVETRVVPARLGARVRWRLWLAGRLAKRWAKRVLRRPTPPTGPAEEDGPREGPDKESPSAEPDQAELVGAAGER